MRMQGFPSTSPAHPSRSSFRAAFSLLAAALLPPLVMACRGSVPPPETSPATVPVTVTRAPAAQTLVVDGRSVGLRFDGVGGVSSGGSSRLLLDYPEPERTQILDYVFKPDYGSALQLLKVEIGGEMNGTVGSEASHMRTRDDLNCDRGYEWWIMKEAKRRNPQIKLAGLQWGAPGWFDGGFWSRDNIDYLIKWLDCAKEQGLTIDYMGGWNESGTNPAWYVDFARVLRQAYPGVQIIAADNTHTGHWNAAITMTRDSAFNAATDIVGVHGPGGSRTNPEYTEVDRSEPALSLRKPLWASEFSSLAHDVGAIPLARVFNRSYIDARITGQMIWTPLSAWYPTIPIPDTGPVLAEWPWSGFYKVGKSVWSLAHTTQFTAAGWHYLDSGSRRLASGATVVSLASGSGDYTIIVEAMDVTAPTTLDLQLENLPSRPLHLWVTDLASDEGRDHFRQAGRITPEGGKIRLDLKPRHLYTVTTRTSGGKGDARPRGSVHDQMALPYREDFDSLEAGRLVRYFSDVNGSFETHPCSGGRTGMCFRQTVNIHPIEWHGPDMPPTSIAGDARWWGDYRISTDVMLEDSGYVELLARVDGVGGDEWVSGYHFQAGTTGAWRLYAKDVLGTEVTLATGRAPFARGRWHTLALDLRGGQLQALINGRRVTTIRDDRHRVGQIGLRTSRWARAQFDNVVVTPTAAPPQFIPKAALRATATSARETNAYGYTYPASAAIDDRPEAYWRSEWEPAAPMPQAITIDLGSVREVAALTYQPRISGHWAARNPGDPITRYAIHLSTDGSSYERVAGGTWRNSLAATKVANFGAPRRARFVRLEAFQNPLSCQVSVTAGEIGISSTPIADPSPDIGSHPSQLDSVVPHATLSASATGIDASQAAMAAEGDCSTHATLATGGSVTLDLGRNYRVSGLAYTPRQDVPLKGSISRYAVHVSTDGQRFTRVSNGEWAENWNLKVATWAPRQARYVRLEALRASDGAPAVAEIHVGVGR